MGGVSVFGIAVSVLLTSVVLAEVQLKADVIYIQNGNTTSAIFRCSAGQGHMYYLDHVITWSRIGRDGREIYLSLNWDLVRHDEAYKYVISSQVYNEPSVNGSAVVPQMYFVLGKTELTYEDHGEYICRLHDFDRNLLAEYSIPMIIFDQGLAIAPYRIIGQSGKDITVSCMYNTSVSQGSHVALYHVNKDGVPTKVVDNGKLVDVKLKDKYAFNTRRNGDLIIHNILTLKAPTSLSEGHIMCEMRNSSGAITDTNATVSISEPKLMVSPLYFLKVPEDAVAHFKCECAILDTAACINNDKVWSVLNTTTGEVTRISKGGQLLDTSGIYEVFVSQNGSAVNLTVHGLTTGFSRGGKYVCTLHHPVTGAEITQAAIPVSSTPISLGAIALLDGYPAKIRLLCTMSGSMWDSHYFEDHTMAWVRLQSGVTTPIGANGVLATGFDPKKFSMLFDSQRYYSILTITPVEKIDYGDYKCQLTNNYSGKLLHSEMLKVYGKGNITILSSMNN